MDNRSDIFSLHGKNILVTGASSGLGRASCIAAAECGANLILVGRNESLLNDLVNYLPASNKKKIIIADLLQKDSIEAIVNGVREHSLPIDGFIHSAGMSTTLPLKQTTIEKIQEFNYLNVASGVELAGKLSHRQIINTKGASFIFLGSVMGVTGEIGKTIYSLTKGAIISGVRSMAMELAAKKIRVNCISPGVVETPMVASAFYAQQSESFEKVKLLHPLGLGKPDDVANACIFLLSDASRWITGTNLIVDGGYTAK